MHRINTNIKQWKMNDPDSKYKINDNTRFWNFSGNLRGIREILKT